MANTSSTELTNRPARVVAAALTAGSRQRRNGLMRRSKPIVDGRVGSSRERSSRLASSVDATSAFPGPTACAKLRGDASPVSRAA
jgi:hypothetical protein